MKKSFLLTVFLIFSFFGINNVDASCYSEYWINSQSNFNWTCSCRSWYHFETSTFWTTSCVKNPSCTDLYWFNATTNFDWTCSCKSWYYFVDKTFWGWKECKNLNNYCTDKFWYNSSYNSLYDKCECKSWYELSKKSFWSWYECKSCYSKYWLNSWYNRLTKSCECDNWYNLKDWKCEKKHNSAYFFLNEYNDDDNEVIVYSYTTKKTYLLELRYTSRLYKAEDFIWKSIVINMWTDFSVDKYDKFILNNQTKTTDIVVDILDVEEIDDDYTLKTCEDIFGNYSEKTYDNKCVCISWYEWNYNKTSCVFKTLNTSNNIFEPNNLFESNTTMVNNTICWNNSISKEIWICNCIEWYTWEEKGSSTNMNCILKKVESKKEEIIETIDKNLKNKIDTIFKKIKNKFINENNDKQLLIYKNLNKKIKKILSTRLSDNNKIIITYLNSLVEKEILNLEKKEDTLDD